MGHAVTYGSVHLCHKRNLGIDARVESLTALAHLACSSFNFNRKSIFDQVGFINPLFLTRSDPIKVDKMFLKS